MVLHVIINISLSGFTSVVQSFDSSGGQGEFYTQQGCSVERIRDKSEELRCMLILGKELKIFKNFGQFQKIAGVQCGFPVWLLKRNKLKTRNAFSLTLLWLWIKPSATALIAE